MTLSWDEQLRKLKQKQEQTKQQDTTYRAVGRCSCGCARFGHRAERGKLIRICRECKAERVF